MVKLRTFESKVYECWPRNSKAPISCESPAKFLTETEKPESIPNNFSSPVMLRAQNFLTQNLRLESFESKLLMLSRRKFANQKTFLKKAKTFLLRGALLFKSDCNSLLLSSFVALSSCCFVLCSFARFRIQISLWLPDNSRISNILRETFLVQVRLKVSSSSTEQAGIQNVQFSKVSIFKS